ncbi:MAG: type IVB secretion system protein IcmJDotN [Pseudomonadota bacterium]
MAQIGVTLGIARHQAGNSALPPTTPALVGSVAPAGITPELRREVLKRDDHACQCCGFRSEKYQEILHINQDTRDTRLDNLATTCQFCHQCFAVDKVAQMRSGVLIWLPELTQTELNHLSRALYVARISQGPMADTSRKILDMLMTRREDVRRRLGTDDVFVLATVLRDYVGQRHYAERHQKLDGVRLFPLDRRIIKEADLEFNQFPQILAYWRSKDGPFGGKVPTAWIDMYRETFRQVG